MANIPQDSTIPLWSSEPSAVTDHLSIPVGQQCISSLPDWHVTSAKPGAGVDCLLHDSVGVELAWRPLTTAVAGRVCLATRTLCPLEPCCVHRTARCCRALHPTRPQDTTYWQSDGKAPHALDLQFPRRTAVSGLAVQLSYLKDESYTPSLIHIACGDSPAELSIIRSEELAQTDGYVCALCAAVRPLARHMTSLPRIPGGCTSRCWLLHM